MNWFRSTVVVTAVGAVGGAAAVVASRNAPSTPLALPAGAVVIDDNGQRLPAVLRSEWEAGRQTAAVTAMLRNTTADPQAVAFRGVSCGCTGVSADDRTLARDDTLTLPPNGRITLRVSSNIPNAAGVRPYLAFFDRLPAGGPVERLPPVEYHAGVVPDLRAVPDVVSHQFGRGEAGLISKPVEVAWHYRAAAPRRAELSFDAPSHLRLVRSTAQPPREVEPGMWCQAWAAVVRVAPPDGDDLSDAAVPLHWRVAAADGPAGATVAASALVRRSLGVRAPRSLAFAAGASKRLLLQSDDGTAFRITAVRSTSAAFAATPADDTPRKAHVVDVRFQPADGGGDGELVIDTDHPGRPRLSVALAGPGR